MNQIRSKLCRTLGGRSGEGKAGRDGRVLLRRVVKEGPTKKVTFELRPEAARERDRAWLTSSSPNLPHRQAPVQDRLLPRPPPQEPTRWSQSSHPEHPEGAGEGQ